MRNPCAASPTPIDRRRRPLLVTLLATLVLLATAACGADEGAGGSSGAASPSTPEYKITVAGDSISVGLGAALRGAVDDQRDTVVKVIGVEGTGLARPDNFDWPARLTELARDFPPQVLVLSLGSNDAQDLVDADGKLVAARSDTAAWEQEYSARLAASFDAFRDTGTHVIWVGHVRTQEERVGTTNRRVHELAAAVAADRDWVQVEDLAEYLGSGEGIATTCLIEDGLHLTTTCLDQAATKLAADLPSR